MTCFRAALNLAYLDGLLTTDFSWCSKLRPIKNADRRRELYLDRRLKVLKPQRYARQRAPTKAFRVFRAFRRTLIDLAA